MQEQSNPNEMQAITPQGDSPAYIVDVTKYLFRVLRILTLSEQIEHWFIKQRKFRNVFVETWVLIGTLLAVLAWSVQFKPAGGWQYVTFFFIGWRVFEIIIQQLNVHLFDPLDSPEHKV